MTVVFPFDRSEMAATALASAVEYADAFDKGVVASVLPDTSITRRIRFSIITALEDLDKQRRTLLGLVESDERKWAPG